MKIPVFYKIPAAAAARISSHIPGYGWHINTFFTFCLNIALPNRTKGRNSNDKIFFNNLVYFEIVTLFMKFLQMIMKLLKILKKIFKNSFLKLKSILLLVNQRLKLKSLLFLMTLSLLELKEDAGMFFLCWIKFFSKTSKE